MDVISVALNTYNTDNVEPCLRRIGIGICPKSFPISPWAFSMLDLYRLTHGGEYGLDLVHLPFAGALTEQPNVFFASSDIISSVRSQHFSDRMEEDKKKSEINTDDRKL